MQGTEWYLYQRYFLWIGAKRCLIFEPIFTAGDHDLVLPVSLWVFCMHVNICMIALICVLLGLPSSIHPSLPFILITLPSDCVYLYLYLWVDEMTRRLWGFSVMMDWAICPTGPYGLMATHHIHPFNLLFQCLMTIHRASTAWLADLGSAILAWAWCIWTWPCSMETWGWLWN